LRENLGDRRGEGHALSNIGTAYYGLGQYHTALQYDDLGLQIARAIGNSSGEADALFNSATALENLGDRNRAISRAETALRIYGAMESPHASKVRDQLAKWRGEPKARGQSSAE
jgi:tetratricopeptide (TPR) repeat protein